MNCSGFGSCLLCFKDERTKRKRGTTVFWHSIPFSTALIWSGLKIFNRFEKKNLFLSSGCVFSYYLDSWKKIFCTNISDQMLLILLKCTELNLWGKSRLCLFLCCFALPFINISLCCTYIVNFNSCRQQVLVFFFNV